MNYDTNTNQPAGLFTGLSLAAPVQARNLTMFPLVGDDRPGPAYLTLREALAKNLAVVTEVSQGGSVPELQLRNDADVAVLLLDGEELVGAKQNRVLNLSILVQAHASLTIPVSCVEQGRWTYSTREFSSSDRTLFAKARHSKLEQVSDSLRANAGRRSDQGAVWDSIAEKFEAFRESAPTAAMSDAYASRADVVEEIVSKLRPSGQQRGAVFAIDGRVIGVEFFDRSSTLQDLLATVVRGYALDAVETRGGEDAIPPTVAAASFLAAVDCAEVRGYPALGLGQDLRLEGDGAVGAALQVDQTLVHLTAFAGASGSRRSAGGSRRGFGLHTG